MNRSQFDVTRYTPIGMMTDAKYNYGCEHCRQDLCYYHIWYWRMGLFIYFNTKSVNLLRGQIGVLAITINNCCDHHACLITKQLVLHMCSNASRVTLACKHQLTGFFYCLFFGETMSSHKTRRESKQRMCTALEQVSLNKTTEAQGPKKKKWSKHDLRRITPMTDNQDYMIRTYFGVPDSNIVASGSAGSGKTMLAMFLGFSDILDNGVYKKMIIVRSAVPTRDVGFLPGTLEEKTALYEAPYRDICQFLFGKPSTYADMKEANLIDFQTTSFIRGVTWDNAIVVVDECQSMTMHELNTIITRLGDNSRIIIVGDLPQTDLRAKHETSGMSQLLDVVRHMDEFQLVRFTRDDIVRSKLVKSWIIACEDNHVVL